MRHFLSINTLWFSNSSPESEWIRWNRKECLQFFFSIECEQNNYSNKEVSHSPDIPYFKEIKNEDYTMANAWIREWIDFRKIET